MYVYVCTYYLLCSVLQFDAQLLRVGSLPSPWGLCHQTESESELCSHGASWGERLVGGFSRLLETPGKGIRYLSGWGEKKTDFLQPPSRRFGIFHVGKGQNCGPHLVVDGSFHIGDPIILSHARVLDAKLTIEVEKSRDIMAYVNS